MATIAESNYGTGYNTPDIDRRRPHAPRDFVASSPADFTIVCHWTDQGSPNGFGNVLHPVIVQSWYVYVCSAQLAGSGDVPYFRDVVVRKGHPVASIRSNGRGETMSLSITDSSFTDVYVTVVGSSVDGILGVPAEPQLLYPGGIPLGNLDPVTSPAANLTAVTDSYGNHFVDVGPSYVAPLILGRFFGVSVYAVGYLGNSVPQELGNVVLYRRTVPGQSMTGSIILPRDEDQTPTTLYFVAVDRQGRRDDNYTGAPSVALANGIYA